MPTYPTLRYADAPAAIAWLESAFGLTTRTRYDNEDGTVAHAELVAGDGLVMCGSARDDNADVNSTPGQVTVYVGLPDVADVERRWTSARAAGARVLRELAVMDYGDASHEFSCADPEGNVWSFGTYAPTP
jgi:uncharacterized glyoxalase superfamily protein PhnB